MPLAPLFLWATIYSNTHNLSDLEQYRSLSRLTPSHMHVSTSCRGDVRTNWSCYGRTRAYFVSVYYNSLLATLNVRKKIGGKGHGDLGISLRPFDNSNSSAANNHKVDGLVCLVLPLIQLLA